MDPDTAALARWQQLLPGATELGRELVRAYADPVRHYHDVHHMLAVLAGIDELASVATAPRLVSLAGFFHDAVYDAPSADNEERSAQLAGSALEQAGLTADEAAEVARLVRLTTRHDPVLGDRDGAVLCDADLAVLAGAEASYAAYVRAVRAEYSFASDDQWRTGRSEVLERLLGLDRLFHTALGHLRWEARARRNLAAELAALNVS
ncbi:MAG: HD domain-containing protein [Nocardioidaceae bacterium]